MPVSISLELLVAMPGTKSLWPSEFVAFVEAMEAEPDEMSNWAVLADWLKDHDEYGLEEAVRYVVKREQIRAVRITGHKINAYWGFNGLPPSVLAVQVGKAEDSTLAGLIADLAARLRKHREEGE